VRKAVKVRMARGFLPCPSLFYLLESLDQYLFVRFVNGNTIHTPESVPVSCLIGILGWLVPVVSAIFL
jgi:hypothetical protein